MMADTRRISEAQEKYIDSQIHLFDRILAKVDSTFEFENYDKSQR
ncbi:hypothetical protein ABPH35_10810 [Streptococcus sp. ZJ93]